MEMTEQNAREFRAEWVKQCGNSCRLAGKEIRLRGFCPEILQAAEQILAAHGAKCSETESLTVCLEEKSITVRGGFGELVVHTPVVFGGGLPLNCGGNAAVLSKPEIPAIHAVDYFQVLLLALEQERSGTFSLPSPELPYTDQIQREAAVRALRLLRDHPQRRFYDDTAYGGLEPLHRVLLECLLEMDRVCRENGIRYFLGGGTLLGAVRHQGFIPWDDDVDVMMTRPDYERFAQIAPTALKETFFFQSRQTEPDYHSPFAKLRARGTLYMTEFSSRFPNMEQGIFLDIFVHDAAPRWGVLVKPHIFMTIFARSLVFHKWEGTPLHFYGRMKLLCRLMTWVIKRRSISSLEAFEQRVMTFWNGKNTGYLYDGMGEHLKHGRFPARLLETGAEAIFEGHPFPIPGDYDAYLRFSYGDDYMSWPMPSSRCCHHHVVQFSAQRGGCNETDETGDSSGCEHCL